MALVKKLNTELTVPEEKVKEYLDLGYSLIDTSGKVLQSGKATTKDEFLAENQNLKTAVESLMKELEKKDKTIEKLKKQVETLQAGKSNIKDEPGTSSGDDVDPEKSNK